MDGQTTQTDNLQAPALDVTQRTGPNLAALLIGALMVAQPILAEVQAAQAAGLDVNGYGIASQIVGGLLLALTGWRTPGVAFRRLAPLASRSIVLPLAAALLLLACSAVAPGCGGSLALRVEESHTTSQALIDPPYYDAQADTLAVLALGRQAEGSGDTWDPIGRIAVRESIGLVADGDYVGLRQCLQIALNPPMCYGEEEGSGGAPGGVCDGATWLDLYCPGAPIPLRTEGAEQALQDATEGSGTAPAPESIDPTNGDPRLE